jgi:hypothetical protein
MSCAGTMRNIIVASTPRISTYNSKQVCVSAAKLGEEMGDDMQGWRERVLLNEGRGNITWFACKVDGR